MRLALAVVTVVAIVGVQRLEGDTEGLAWQNEGEKREHVLEAAVAARAHEVFHEG